MSGPCSSLPDHRRDVGGIVLQVAVGGDDEPAAGVREAGGERRGLAEVAAEADHAQPRVRRVWSAASSRNVSSVLPSSIASNLERTAERLERGGQLAVELLDVGRLVAHRYDDRDLWLHLRCGR